MKPFYKSLTFWSIVLSLVGLALAGVGRGEPLVAILASQEVQETLGELLAALGFGGIAYGRARASEPLSLGRGKGDERGAVAVVALLLVAFAAALLASACGPRVVRAERSVDVDVRRGPPCSVRVTADGKLVAHVDWAKRCEVEFAEGER
jgi:hypothetical protein